jgi:archaellum component FlaC
LVDYFVQASKTLMETLHDNNVYAHNRARNIKHISEVASGKKGYRCMGCACEMVAKKGTVIAHHFAHDPKDVERQGKCYFSDETYRHGVAKDTLLLLKQIKVPAVYKYPPTGHEGRAVKLAEATLVVAHRIEIEMPFYEVEDGTVKWGKHLMHDGHTGRHLLIQPDVAFFDAAGRPILLVELVATHKVDKAKLFKIRRLGLNVVQVAIPKGSPQEIEQVFFSTARTEWLYNYEQEQTDYLLVSAGSGEGIPPLDEFQRKLLKAVESYECRAVQLNNLIRAIDKCLGSEPYRTVEHATVEQIRRVEENAERVSGEWRQLQERTRQSVEDNYRAETEELDSEAEQLSESERALTRKSADLEGRYRAKASELVAAQRSYQSDCQAEIERVERDLGKLGQSRDTAGEQTDEIKREEERLAECYRREEEGIERDTSRIRQNMEGVEQAIPGLPSRHAELDDKLRSEFAARTIAARQEAERSETGMRAEFERAGGESLKAIAGRDCERVTRSAQRVKAVLEGRRLLLLIDEEIRDIQRLRKAKAILDSQSYKNWS